MALQKEVSSFENSKIEEEEYWKFEKLLGTAGPFGAILDGQNISPLEASPKYVSMAPSDPLIHYYNNS